MTWKKIDDGAAVEDGAAHAWLASALRRNANSYPTQLARSVAHVYQRFDNGAQTDGPQVVATHPEVAAGNWYLIDVGNNATRLDIRITYWTATATESVRVQVKHPRSGSQSVETKLPSSTSITYEDVHLDLRSPLSGVQPFWLGFRSTIAENPDEYPPSLLSGIASQVFAYQPVAPGTAWSGKTTKLLVIPSFTNTSTNVNALPSLFFVGYSAPAPQFDSGTDIGLRMDIWPDLDTQPAALPYLGDTTKSVFANTYDLGVCYVSSVAFAVTVALDDTYTPAYAHDGMSAAGMLAYQVPQRTAANTNGATLAIAPSPNGEWHGRVLNSGEGETRVFVATEKQMRVTATIVLIATGVDAVIPKYQLEVYDAAGALIHSDTTDVEQSTSAWVVPRVSRVPSPAHSLVMANMQHTEGEWGMGSVSADTDVGTMVMTSVSVTVDVDKGDALTAVFTYDPDDVAGPGLLYGISMVAYGQVPTE